MLTFITLPETFVASLQTHIGNLATDVMPVLILAIGLPLGFYVVRRVIGLVKAR